VGEVPARDLCKKMIEAGAGNRPIVRRAVVDVREAAGAESVARSARLTRNDRVLAKSNSRVTMLICARCLCHYRNLTNNAAAPPASRRHPASQSEHHLCNAASFQTACSEQFLNLIQLRLEVVVGFLLRRKQRPDFGQLGFGIVRASSSSFFFGCATKKLAGNW